MASIVDLSWTTSEDLLEDIDLDALYARQLEAIGGRHYNNYPYLILVYTGKITIGINLGTGFEPSAGFPFPGARGHQGCQDALFSWNPLKEPSE